MCNFFSFVTKGSQKYYFDWKQRQELLKNNPEDYEPDSHTSICHYHKLNDDKVNKYEYNPLSKKFKVDQINIKDDQAVAKKWVENLDFNKVVEPLIIKPIIHPLKVKSPEWNNSHLELLKQWDSVWGSVWDSVRGSVWDSVRDSVVDSVRGSVGDSVWGSVGDSVGDSVWDSVVDSVRDSVGDSVRGSVVNSVRDSVWGSVVDSVRDSVWGSVRAYISSFFKLEQWRYIGNEKGINPFQSCIDLWELGFVPSFDGEIWRIHSGEKAEIVFEITKKEIINK